MQLHPVSPATIAHVGSQSPDISDLICSVRDFKSDLIIAIYILPNRDRHLTHWVTKAPLTLITFWMLLIIEGWGMYVLKSESSNDGIA